MSRTYVHAPAQYNGDNYTTHNTVNLRNRQVKRDTRRIVRHAPIDEESVELVNAMAERKRLSYVARNRYW